MNISKEFKYIIEDDIELCKDVIAGRSNVDIHDFHFRLISKYDGVISGFSDKLRDVFYDSDNSTKKANIETMCQKLELFVAMGYKWGVEEKNEPQQSPLVSVSNVNNNSLSVSVTFPEVRKQVENMSALPEAEIKEVLAKIDELEKIVNSKVRKGQKWEQAKGIIRWIADKGVDVGIALLPLLLQIQ